MATRTAEGEPEADAEVAVSIRHRPAHTLVALRGEIDIATAPALRERLFDLLHPGMKLLILDLSEVSFCAAAGLAVMIGTQRRATPLGITLHLIAPQPQTAQLLHITGLDRSLTIHPTLPDSLAFPPSTGGVMECRP
jgi:anti-anti-sigma factor